MISRATPAPGTASDDGGVSDEDQQARIERLRRKRRLAEIFGDVLPESTSDDRAEHERGGDPGRWYRENTPPHHGG